MLNSSPFYCFFRFQSQGAYPPPKPQTHEQLIPNTATSTETQRIKELEEENAHLKWLGKVGAGIFAAVTGGLLLFHALSGSKDSDSSGKKKKGRK